LIDQLGRPACAFLRCQFGFVRRRYGVFLTVSVASSERWWTVIVSAAASTTADRKAASFPVF